MIDGRIVAICESGWFVHRLLVPRFVLEELQGIADSGDIARKEKGRKGLNVLDQLRAIDGIELRIHESDAPDRDAVDSKLIYLVEVMKAKLPTTDFNLAKLTQWFLREVGKWFLRLTKVKPGTVILDLSSL